MLFRSVSGASGGVAAAVVLISGDLLAVSKLEVWRQ
tara:strand:+ start:723 stop:830 length:108 start_codon:yes stop_codon:yes gene_type:complete